MRKTLLSVFAVLASLSLMAQPTTLPADPPARSDLQVISFYGDAYTNVADINYNPGWGQATKVNDAFPVAGSTVLQYAGLTYQGTEFLPGVNAGDMTHLHIDIWSTKSYVVDLYPVWRNASGPGQGESSKKLTLVANQWSSFDIPITDFSGINKAAIFQFKIQDHGGNASDIYITNWYFYTNAEIVDNDPPTGFTATAGTKTKDNIELVLFANDNFSSVVYTIKYGDVTETANGSAGAQTRYVVDVLEPGTEYTFNVTVADAAGNVNATTIPVTASTLADPLARPTSLLTPTLPIENVFPIISTTYGNYNFNFRYWVGTDQNTINSVINVAGKRLIRFENFDFQAVEFVGAGGALDLTGFEKVHIDVWTPNETGFGFSVGGTGSNPVSCSPLKQGEWNSYDFPISYLAVPAIADVQVMSYSGGSGKTVYVDNLIFYKGEYSSIKSFNTPTVAKEVAKKQYFTIDGRAVSNPESGMFIVKKIFTDGSVGAEKVLIK